MLHIRKLLLFFMLLLFSSAYSQEQNIPVAKQKKDITYLFVEVASGAKLQKDNNLKDYVVTLYGVEPWVTYFSNVPARVTGFMSIEDFNKIMNKEVNDSYPKGLNSGLIALNNNKSTLRYTFSLSEPNYNSTTKVITFKAKAVPGTQTDPIPDKADFKHIALFIDGACVSCGGSGF